MKKLAIALVLICMTTSAFAAINFKVGSTGIWAGALSVGPEITFSLMGGKINAAVDAAYLYGGSNWSAMAGGLTLLMPLKGDISAGLLVSYSSYSPTAGKAVDLPLAGTLTDNAGIGYGVVVGKPMKLLGKDMDVKVGYDTRLGLLAAASILIK